MRVVVIYRQEQKQLKKSTLARPPIYDRPYADMLSTAPPGNPVGIIKRSSLLLFVLLDTKFLEESTKVTEDLFFVNFHVSAINPPENFARSRNLHGN